MTSNADKCRNLVIPRDWQHCSVCDGRIHRPDCSARRDRNRDCCEARHAMLFAAGHTVGIYDSSQPMYNHAERTWADLSSRKDEETTTTTH